MPLPPKRVLLAIQIATVVLAQHCYSQSQYRFKHLTAADGLERKYAASIIQDGRGFLWITDFISLTRFDGYTSKVYVTNPDDSLVNLGHTPMAGFMGGERQAIDANGNLWINESKTKWDKGYLLKYDQKADGFIRYKPDLKGASVSAFGFEKDSPIVWLGTEFGKGLISYNTKTNKTEWFLHPHPDSVMNWNQNMICKIRDHQTYLLLATFNGLWKFDKRTKTFSRPPSNARDSALLYSTPVWNVIDKPFPNDGTVWLELPFGVVKVDTNFSVIHRLDFPKGFHPRNIGRNIDDVLWIGHGGGVSRYNPADRSIVHLRITIGPYSISGGGGGLIVDKDQNVWVPTGNGIDLLQRKSLRFYNSKVGNSTPYVAILPVKNGEQLVAVNPNNTALTAPLNLLDSITFQSIPIQGRPIGPNFHLTWVGRNYFWITTIPEPGWAPGGVVGLPLDPATGMIQSGPVQYYSHDPGNPNTIRTNDILSVYEDPNEDLWVGTFTELNKVNRSMPYGTKGSVTSFVHDPANVNSLSMNGIFTMSPEDSTAFWIATLGGVDKFHNGKIERIFNRQERVRTFLKGKDGTMYVGTDRGMFIGKIGKGHYEFTKSVVVTEPVISMSEDKNGRIWVHGYWGLKCYEPARDIAISFDGLDGLVRPSTHGPQSLHRSASGLMVFKGNDAISIFDPLSLRISEEKTLPLLTALSVNNLQTMMVGHPHAADEFTTPVDITELEELVLDYQHNNFSLEFAAMELTAPERNLYQYKLDGYDDNWVFTTAKDRTATYTNLPADDYIFKVKASNHHGVWSDQERTLKITIMPPPWRTWWAYTGYSLLAVGLLLVARRNIVQRERLKSNFKLEHLELEKAKEVDRVKTSFFTNISHEFRTPLTLIKGPVENLLERFKDDPDVIQRLKLVQRNSDLLLKLINQLLDLARLESGTLKVEKSEADLFSFIRAIASSFESFARQKGVSLSVDVPALSQPALFDKDKLETILINLVNNAIKFTPPGGTIRVAAACGASPPAPLHGRGELLLCVSDTGIGIPLDQQSKIFERFHQVSEAHKEVGTGIGLSLVKELVSLLGGTISVKSEPGKGSEFTAILPLEILGSEHHGVESTTNGVPGQQPAARSQQQVIGISNVQHPILNVEVDSSKPQVLVVEDNADLRAFIIDSLGNEFAFLEAENGVQGLEKATTEVPDIIISDVMMPEMDGITMAGKIKKDIRSSHIPLILLTAKSTEDSMLSGLQSGADDYLTKPFNKNELLLKVRNRIEAQAKIRERIKLELLSEGPKVEVQSADEQFLQKVKESILSRLADEQLSVESLADEIGLSRSQLFRKIVALTGVSANELIRKFRLQKAAQLLQQNWGPVSQVAYEVGFSNLSYFSKVFKEEFGVLPSEYEKV